MVVSEVEIEMVCRGFEDASLMTVQIGVIILSNVSLKVNYV